MLSQAETHRLAAAINALRPDWPLASLSTWIRTSLAERAYRDAAVALTWVACDPQSETPARVLEAGPWWRAAQAEQGAASAVKHRGPGTRRGSRGTAPSATPRQCLRSASPSSWRPSARQ